MSSIPMFIPKEHKLIYSRSVFRCMILKEPNDSGMINKGELPFAPSCSTHSEASSGQLLRRPPDPSSAPQGDSMTSKPSTACQPRGTLEFFPCEAQYAAQSTCSAQEASTSGLTNHGRAKMVTGLAEGLLGSRM